jgi:hypothetical protein
VLDCGATAGEEAGQRQRKQQAESRMPHPPELSRTDPSTTDRYNFVPLLSVSVSDRIATLRLRTMSQLFMHRRRLHRHTGVRTYVLLQRLGVPYEVERTICSECRQVLDERQLKRAAA